MGRRVLHKTKLGALAAVVENVQAQRIIAENGNEYCAERLSANPRLHPEVATMIASGPYTRAASIAVRRTDDAELLETLLCGSVRNHAWGLRNPHVGVDRLCEAASRNHHPAGQCAAVSNPDTPESVRRAYVTPATIDRLTHGDGTSRTRAVRAYTIVRNNPWMLEAPEQWPSSVQAVFLYIPEVSRDVLQRLQRVDTAARDLHPAYLPKSIETYHTQDLVALGGPAIDEYVLRQRGDIVKYFEAFDVPTRRRRLSSAHLGCMYESYGRAALVRHILKRPQGVAAIVERGAGSWISPGIGIVQDIEYENLCALGEIEHILGACEDSWRMFIALVSAGGERISWMRQAAAVTTLMRL